MFVAVVGSSGGGAATLGHTDPADLLRTIQSELSRVSSSTSARIDEGGGTAQCPSIRHALYVSLHGGRGLDSASDEARATLYAVGCTDDDDDDSADANNNNSDNNNNNSSDTTSTFLVRTVCTGPLRTVNEECRRLDSRYVASSILRHQITGGLICISADPTDVNRCSVGAAADTGIPVTGSGGTSLSAMVSQMGVVNLVGNAGGSVATTTYTRAVSYVCALAGAWGEEGWTYSPFGGGSTGSAVDDTKVRPHMGSVLDSCVPAFVAVCVSCRLLEAVAHLVGTDVLIDADSIALGQVQYEDGDLINRLLYHLRFHALPTVCAVVSGTAYAPEFGSVAVMSSGIASAACGGSVLAGLLAGWLVAWLVGRALFACIRLNIPATMTNIIVAGGVGSAVALILGGSGLVGALAWATHHFRSLVRLSLLPDAIARSGTDGTTATTIPGLGFIFGMVFCYGSKVGWYHAVFLPVILLEMERGRPSVWGACDECTLVLVSAGICLANVLTGAAVRPSSTTSGTAPLTTSSPSGVGGTSAGDVPISWRGLKINLLCGDFIEAAYPFMERSKVVNAFAYIASGASTEILYGRNPERTLSSAYLPVVISVWLSEDWRRTALACGAAFSISFIGGFLANAISHRHSASHKIKSK